MPQHSRIIPITLDYGAVGAKKLDPKQKRLNNLSTVVQIGQHLWLASDEDATIQRLSWAKGRYAAARSFDIAAHFDLTFQRSKKSPEFDFEGLSVSGHHLWIAGSHSRKRPKLKDEKDRRDDSKAIEPVVPATLRPERCFLGYVELNADYSDIVRGSGACLPIGDNGNEIVACISEDALFKPFLELGDKENGLNIEGLGVKGERVFLGLRGPVIDRKAVIIEVVPALSPGSLSLTPIGANGARIRKYFFDFDGLGIRDLAVDGEDLLILVGPTTGQPGPWSIRRWRRAFECDAEGQTPSSALELCATIRSAEYDHPEGLSSFNHPEGRNGILLVYDRPSARRITDEGTYEADLLVD